MGIRIMNTKRQNKKLHIRPTYALGIVTLLLAIAVVCGCGRKSENEALLYPGPDDVQQYMYKGFTYAKNGQYDKAISEFNKVIKIDPTNDEAYDNRGIAYMMMDKFSQAMSNYTKAIKINNTNANAYNNRGLLYAKYRGKYDKAIADFTKAIDIEPDFIDAYISRGMAYSYKNQYDKAISDYDKAIDINPREPNAHYNRGVAYYNKAEYGKAWDDIKKAQILNPEVVNQKFLETLRLKMAEPKATPSREKGLSVHFIIKAVAAENPAYPQGFIVTGKGKITFFKTPEELIRFFSQQDKEVQNNGIWLLVTNLDAYTEEDKAAEKKLEELCRQQNIKLFKARGLDLSPAGKN